MQNDDVFHIQTHRTANLPRSVITDGTDAKTTDRAHKNPPLGACPQEDESPETSLACLISHMCATLPAHIFLLLLWGP
jgi:hypothetical protein